MDAVIPIGRQVPKFQLPDLNGNIYSLETLRGSIVVLNFWSAECTWCERVDHDLSTYLEAWKGKVRVWWIASNANETRGLITRVATERNLPVVLLDAQQDVAERLGAQVTPHIFVVDGEGNLAYQGAWDDVTFRRRVPTQVYVPEVVEAISTGRVPKITQTQPYGCVLVKNFEEGT